MLVVSLAASLLMLNLASVAASSEPVDGCVHFEETGHNLCDAFEVFWNENDGAGNFGMPLTDAYEEINADTLEPAIVQYVGKARLEVHPQNAGTPYEILAGRVGDEALLYGRGVDWWTLPAGDPAAPNYFSETGHAIAGEFWEYWSSHGIELGDEGVSFRESLALFGFPISEAALESSANNDNVMTQWFERARLEIGPDGQVVMADLGVEMTSTDDGFSPRIQRELDANLQYWHAELDLPGIMAGVWVPGVGAWTGVLGEADTSTGEPLAFDQHVRIGSVTKTYTVTLILQLADEGLLSLDDTVDMYFDDVPNGDTITLRHLASLTSGLASYTVDPDFQDTLFSNPQRAWEPEELVEIGLRNTAAGCPYAPTACFPAGTDWFYSNTNTVMLGLIVEQVTGRSYAEVLEELILVPLGLENTWHPSSSDLPEPFAHGYTTQGLPDDAVGVQDATFWNPSWGWGVGDIVSTFDDLYVWGRALGSGELLSAEMQAERLTKLTVGPNTPERSYALGIGFKNGWWGHGGELPGYNATTYYRPDLDAVIVVVVNSDQVPYEGGHVDPAYLMTDAISDVAGREAPLGDFDGGVPWVDDSLAGDDGE